MDYARAHAKVKKVGAGLHPCSIVQNTWTVCHIIELRPCLQKMVRNRACNIWIVPGHKNIFLFRQTPTEPQ
jgi:hypothetical protein